MRISDWSSDVCSSDLIENRRYAISTCAVRHSGLRHSFLDLNAPELCRGHRSNRPFPTARRKRAARRSDRRRSREICIRSEEHTSELQSLMRISYAVFCLKKKKHNNKHKTQKTYTTR